MEGIDWGKVAGLMRQIADELEGKQKTPRAKKTAEPSQANVVIAAYCDAWQDRYKAKAIITRQHAGTISTLLKSMSADKLTELVKAYLRMNDTWFIKQRHDLMTFQRSISQVSHFSQTGARITNSRLQQMDRLGDNMDLMERVNNGEI
jgi:hypothetical protein